MSSPQRRANIVILLYKAILGIIEFDVDTEEVEEFFKDRLYYINGCLLCLGSEYTKFESIQRCQFDTIRSLSGVSLAAFLGMINTDFDYYSTSYQWVSQQLGIEKGQYDGLLPSLLKEEITYLVNIADQAEIELPDYDDHIDRLLYIEDFLTLVLHAVQMCSGLVALIDNGIVNHILAVLKVKCSSLSLLSLLLLLLLLSSLFL